MINRRAQSILPSAIRQITDRAGPNSLHLGLGQPSLPLHPAVEAAIRTACTSHAPYGPNLGTASAREAVAHHYGIDPAQAMITCGVQEGLALAILGMVEPGDDVLVPDPGFPAYANLVRFAGANPVTYGFGDNWSLDARMIAEAATRRTRAIVLNSPSNPTGAVHSLEEIQAVVEWANDAGVFWISDEIYEDFAYGETPHVSPASLNPAGGVRLGGLSKSHAMMGWRMGWLTGPESVIDGLKGLHQHLVTSATVPIQAAISVALGVHSEHMQDVRELFRSRRDVLLAALGNHGIQGYSDGAFYVFLDLRKVTESFGGSQALALKILADLDVVTIPGNGFGAGGEGYLRLAYTVDEDVLKEAGHRLGAFLQAHRSTEV